MRLKDLSEVDIRSGMFYALAALPIGAGVIVATWHLANGIAESDLFEGLMRGWGGALAGYLVLPILLGTLAFYPLAWWRTGRPEARLDRLGLFTRTAAIWLMLLALPAVMYASWGDPGMGLVAPLFIWAWSAVAGGIVADRIALGRRRRAAAATTVPLPETA